MPRKQAGKSPAEDEWLSFEEKAWRGWKLRRRCIAIQLLDIWMPGKNRQIPCREKKSQLLFSRIMVLE
jgi:hypothetical protein